jgi:predicted esterase
VSAAPIESTIATLTHGRYLLRPGEATAILAGFHGYAESADDQLPRLTGIPGSDHWTVVSIQGLHRFYERRSSRVVASWMTRQDRELTIADNIAYVSRVIETVLNGRSAQSLACAGFSQGVAMAFRAAVTAPASRRFVIAVGGDVPPELTSGELTTLSSVLICRGAEDPWYGPEVFDKDVGRLKAAGVDVEALVVPGGHEWSSGVVDAAARFLRDRAGDAAGRRA